MSEERIDWEVFGRVTAGAMFVNVVVTVFVVGIQFFMCLYGLLTYFSPRSGRSGRRAYGRRESGRMRGITRSSHLQSSRSHPGAMELELTSLPVELNVHPVELNAHPSSHLEFPHPALSENEPHSAHPLRSPSYNAPIPSRTSRPHHRLASRFYLRRPTTATTSRHRSLNYEGSRKASHHSSSSSSNTVTRSSNHSSSHPFRHSASHPSHRSSSHPSYPSTSHPTYPSTSNNTSRSTRRAAAKSSPSRNKRKLPYLLTSLLIFTLFGLTASLDAYTQWKTLFESRGGESFYDLTEEHEREWARVTGLFCLFGSLFVGDGVLLYRAYIVWKDKWYVMVLPFLAYLASIGLGLQIASPSPHIGWTTQDRRISSAFTFLAVSVNVMVTFLISYRLVRARRMMEDVVEREYLQIYTRIVELLVESALPVAVFGFGYAVTLVVPLGETTESMIRWQVANMFFAGMYFASATLAPQMIIFRVTTGRSWTKDAGESTFSHSSDGEVYGTSSGFVFTTPHDERDHAGGYDDDDDDGDGVRGAGMRYRERLELDGSSGEGDHDDRRYSHSPHDTDSEPMRFAIPSLPGVGRGGGTLVDGERGDGGAKGQELVGGGSLSLSVSVSEKRESWEMKPVTT